MKPASGLPARLTWGVPSRRKVNSSGIGFVTGSIMPFAGQFYRIDPIYLRKRGGPGERIGSPGPPRFLGYSMNDSENGCWVSGRYPPETQHPFSESFNLG